PNFLRTNLTLRASIAPVYLDTELGISQLLGPQTDFALGLAGGGFADSYSEIRRGVYRRKESFTGHSGELSSSIYHRFNPNQEVPLAGVLRLAVHRSFYEEDSQTAASFKLPDDRTTFLIRAGLRLGGREPTMTAPLAMELSGWYEGQLRSAPDAYGFESDRS